MGSHVARRDLCLQGPTALIVSLVAAAVGAAAQMEKLTEVLGPRVSW